MVKKESLGSLLVKEIKDKAKTKFYRDRRSEVKRFFKTAKGKYAEGDIFLGIDVPSLRKLSKNYYHLELGEIKKLLHSPIHELRFSALLILIAKYQTSTQRKEQKKIVDFYLQNSLQINNWDLVDLSAYKILGDYLLSEASDSARQLLIKLARSKNIWQRRIAIVSTFAFLKAGRKEKTLIIANELLADSEDLIQKANGWMLRELGKNISEEELEKFLKLHINRIPRVTLRYACEKFSPTKKKFFYNL